jgi:hypothetical protein
MKTDGSDSVEDGFVPHSGFAGALPERPVSDAKAAGVLTIAVVPFLARRGRGCIEQPVAEATIDLG